MEVWGNLCCVGGCWGENCLSVVLKNLWEQYQDERCLVSEDFVLIRPVCGGRVVVAST